MHEIKLVIDELKRRLKKHDITYVQVAEHLGLSEASIKRMFSHEQFSLDRLASICRLINMNMIDLVMAVEENQPELDELRYEQEKEIVQDEKLLMVALATKDRVSFVDILNSYEFTEPELIQLMVRLDRLGIIELLPNNRYKFLVANDFRWIKNGPIETYFRENAFREFIQASRVDRDGYHAYISGLFSEESSKELIRQSKKLKNTFAELSLIDSKLPLAKKRHWGLFIAAHPWNSSLTKKFTKNE